MQDGYVMLHLGVLYLELKQYKKALDLFVNQNNYNPISEVNYYNAICYRNLGDVEKAIANLNEALNKYDRQLTMTDSYRQLPDEIYRSDITSLLEQYKAEK